MLEASSQPSNKILLHLRPSRSTTAIILPTALRLRTLRPLRNAHSPLNLALEHLIKVVQFHITLTLRRRPLCLLLLLILVASTFIFQVRAAAFFVLR